MKNLSLNVTVPADRRLVVQLPVDVEPGAARLVLISAPKPPVFKDYDEDPLAWLPQFHLTSWPANFPMRREDLYGNDGR